MLQLLVLQDFRDALSARPPIRPWRELDSRGQGMVQHSARDQREVSSAGGRSVGDQSGFSGAGRARRA